MGNDIKSGFGYIIPAAAIIGFVFGLIAEAFLWSVFFASAGILVWFIYMQVMEIKPPAVMGNFIILFGILIAVGLFLAFGLKMNPHGGYEIIPEGSILSFVILFFGVLAGILFNRSHMNGSNSSADLTKEEREAVEKTLRGDGSGETPRVVVIKSEEKKEKTKEETAPEPQYYQNPYYYPEDDEYEDEEYEDEEYEDDDEYEYYDDDEYEDEDEEYEDDEEDKK